MSPTSLIFLILAIVTVAGAAAAMILRNLVHCALAVAVAFTGIGTLYLNLGAQFLGLAQLLVYVGAVAVLIVFVILLTQPSPAAQEALDGQEATGDPFKPAVGLSGTPPLLGVLIASAIFAILGWAVLHSFALQATTTPEPAANIRQLGATLMVNYVLPLEIIGLLLTAALIGAVIIAMKATPMKDTALKEKHSTQ